MFKKNITFKLTLGFLTIVIVSTLFIGIISLNVFKNNIYEVKKDNMKKHALAISQTLQPYLIDSSNEKEFMEIIHLLDSLDNAKIWVLTSDKSIITASDSNPDSITYINDIEVKETYNDVTTKVLTGIEQYDEVYNPYYKEDMMTIAVPIKNNNNSIIGAVVLNSSTSDLSNSMDKFFVYLSLTLLGEILLVGFMGYYFSKNISKPIKKINAAALELARGHYGIKTNIYQKDEIGELSSTFDLLSLKLEYTIGKLFEEKNKLSNIITSMNEGILALDTNFHIINVNQSAIDLLSLKSVESHTAIIQVLSELNIIEEFNSNIYNNAKKSIMKEYKNKVLDFSISPIKNNSNEIIGGVILIQDISEKEKLEQMRKDFISNVSHEFRTPLTIIKGNLESIIDGMTKPEYIADTCVTLIKETNRLERMVKDLLNLSKLESGKLEIDFNELDVNMLINDTIRSLKSLIDTKAIDLQLSIQNNLPPLFSDYDKLKQLLIIFLDNAIKFSKNNGILKVSTYADNKNIYITIKDNGIGIPKNEIQYLGEKFFKADKARNSKVDGTGLGLSIAKRLVKVLNGDFSIESDLDKGTTITLSFLIIQDSMGVKL
ncbi:MAG TPA: ATP-binding protein [Clostridium sp.]